jgi:hypothetical protein
VGLVGERLGQALIAAVDRGRDGGMLAQQVFDAVGLGRGLVVHGARAYRPCPQGPAVAVADGGGLDGVLLVLAGDERPPPRAVGTRPADLGLGAVDAQFDPLGSSVGDHVRQGVQPHAGASGTAKPRRASSGRIWCTARVMVARSTAYSTATA